MVQENRLVEHEKQNIAFKRANKELEIKLADARKRGDKSFERELVKKIAKLSLKHKESIKKIFRKQNNLK